MDHHAGRTRRIGQSAGIGQGLQMRAERIKHRCAVAWAVQLCAQGITVPPLHGVVVVALQMLAVGLQVALMAFADGDAGVAFHPMAVDAVAIDACAHCLHRVA